MAEIWAAAVSAAVGVAAVSYSIASAPGQPKSPDLNAASRAGVEAEAATLGERRRLEAAAQQGGKTDYTTAARTEKRETQWVRAPGGPTGDRQHHGGINAGPLVPYVASEWEQGGKYFQEGQAPPKIITRKQTVKVPAGTATADFTGYGEADVQGTIARKNAQNLLDLQKKYGPGFIEEALKEEELADPEGTAARRREYELIKEQENAKPDRPVANLMDQQVAEQLKAGKGLDRMSDSVLREAVGKAQAARGQGGDANFAEPLTTGFEGEGRLSAAEQKALGWLTSGATPEDVEYRREQQNLSNLSSFMNNRTPESQFQTLSGAQQGPAPYSQGNKLPGQNPNAGAAGANAALGGWNTSMVAANNTASPWLVGLSAAIKGAGAVSTVPRTAP